MLCDNINSLPYPLYPIGVEGKCLFSIIVIQRNVKKALEWRHTTVAVRGVVRIKKNLRGANKKIVYN